MTVLIDAPGAIVPKPSDDEAVLCRIEETIWFNRTQLRNEPGYATHLRERLLECFALLCPSVPYGAITLSVVSTNVAKIHADQLDVLSTRLLYAATRSAEAECPRGVAVCLLAGWLKTAALQAVGEKAVRLAAHQLKRDHELLFERLLGDCKAAA